LLINGMLRYAASIAQAHSSIPAMYFLHAAQQRCPMAVQVTVLQLSYSLLLV
jgi:hypothetical protein